MLACASNGVLRNAVQVVRSRLQQRMDSRALQYSGVADVVKKTFARECVVGFYKGLLPDVLRVMPQSALTFLVYESVMRQLSASSASGDGGRCDGDSNKVER